MSSAKHSILPLYESTHGRARWPGRIVQCILVLFSLIFAFLSVVGLFETCRLDPAAYHSEHTLFVRDNFFLNILVLVLLVFLITAFLIFVERRIHEKTIRIAKAVLCLWVLTLTLIWVFSTQTIPTSDSMRTLDAAARAAKNDFSFFHDNVNYFKIFPFQLNTVSIFEIVYRIFGGATYSAFCVLNAVSLTASFLALVQISEYLFHRRVVTLVTILLSACCLQPVLFASFIYGTLFGLTAILWAFVFLIRYLQTRKPVNLVWILPLCTLAILLKQNYWIAVAAITILLLLSLPYGQKRVKLAFLALLIALPIVFTAAIRNSYERRGNVDLGAGTPQAA